MSAPQAYWKNDKQVNDLSTTLSNDYQTKAGLESAVTTAGFAKSVDIPDVSGFQVHADLDTDVSGLGYAKSADIPDVSGLQVHANLDADVSGLGYAKSADVPDVSGKLDTSVFNPIKLGLKGFMTAMSDASHLKNSDGSDFDFTALIALLA